MEPQWVVLITTVISGAIVLAGRWLDKRRGVPADIDGAIDSHVRFVVESMKERIGVLERSEAACKAELSEQSEKVDDLQLQVNRLLARIDRLNGGSK